MRILQKLSDLKWWILYRTTYRYHIIHIPSLTPHYWEPEDRILHGMFAVLTEFVEKELAWHSWCMSDKNTGLCRFRSKFWRRHIYDRKAGLEHLAWEKTLTRGWAHTQEEKRLPSPQAEAAMEIEALYLWWKDVRPLRQDPMEESGYWSPLSPDHRGTTEQAILTNEIEERNHAEDNAMLKRLVDIRRSMWT